MLEEVHHVCQLCYGSYSVRTPRTRQACEVRLKFGVSTEQHSAPLTPQLHLDEPIEWNVEELNSIRLKFGEGGTPQPITPQSHLYEPIGWNAEEFTAEFDDHSKLHSCDISKWQHAACLNAEWFAYGEKVASILDTTLTWASGQKITISKNITGKAFAMTWNGQQLFAELEEDGRLHWSDGDIWERSCLNALWLKLGELIPCGLISDTILIWPSGNKQVISKDITGKKLTVNIHGQDFTAELQGDGKLHWSDGDIWERFMPMSISTV